MIVKDIIKKFYMINIDKTIYRRGEKIYISTDLDFETLEWRTEGTEVLTGSSKEVNITKLGDYFVYVTASIYGRTFERRMHVKYWPEIFTRDEASKIIKSVNLYGAKDWTGERVWIDDNNPVKLGGIISKDPQNPVHFNGEDDIIRDSKTWGMRIDPGMQNCYFENFYIENPAAQAIVMKCSDPGTPSGQQSKNIHLTYFYINGKGRSTGGGIYVETAGSVNDFIGVYISDGSIKNCADEGLYAGHNVGGTAGFVEGWFSELTCRDNGNDGIQVSKNRNSKIFGCTVLDNGKKNQQGQRSAVNLGSDSQNIEMFSNYIEGAPEGIQMHAGNIGFNYNFYSNHIETSTGFFVRYNSGNQKDPNFFIGGNDLFTPGKDFYFDDQQKKGYKPIYSEEIDYGYDFDGWKRTEMSGAHCPPIVPVPPDPYQDGYNAGLIEGEKTGYQKGYSEGKDYIKTEVGKL